MNHQHMRQLAARFIAEAEADINDALAAGVDPHREFAVLVGRLHNERQSQPLLPSESTGTDRGASRDWCQSIELEILEPAESAGL